jgi:hypothetical protein
MFERRSFEFEIASKEIIDNNIRSVGLTEEETLSTPYRWICQVKVKVKGKDPNRVSELIGTGVLIGPRHILTADNCKSSQQLVV